MPLSEKYFRDQISMLSTKVRADPVRSLGDIFKGYIEDLRVAELDDKKTLLKKLYQLNIEYLYLRAEREDIPSLFEKIQELNPRVDDDYLTSMVITAFSKVSLGDKEGSDLLFSEFKNYSENNSSLLVRSGGEYHYFKSFIGLRANQLEAISDHIERGIRIFQELDDASGLAKMYQIIGEKFLMKQSFGEAK